MTTRITGLATGLDIDSLVSAELSSYNSKITKQQQNKEILEIQQEMYREVITECRDFYDKYFDIANYISVILHIIVLSILIIYAIYCFIKKVKLKNIR